MELKKQVDFDSPLLAACALPEDLLRLERQLCFALYAATRAITKTYMERLGPIDLTYPQYLVLLVLWERDGSTISEIGDRLLLDSGTLTPLVKRLEALGIVRRERNPDDERKVQVYLSEKGMSLKGEVLEARRHVAKRLEMTEHEIVGLRADLMAIVDRLTSGSKTRPLAESGTSP